MYQFLPLDCVDVEKRVSVYTQAGHKQGTVVTSLLDVTEIDTSNMNMVRKGLIT